MLGEVGNQFHLVFLRDFDCVSLRDGQHLFNFTVVVRRLPVTNVVVGGRGLS